MAAPPNIIIIWNIIILLILQTEEVWGQARVPPLGSDYNDVNADGRYSFGFQTGDAGAHYHAAVANQNNQVSGRFGSWDPAQRRIVETEYTSGRRGFRARGPNIARKMDLSQAKIPYNPPVSPNSPNYKPTYDGYHDPNEDPSYSFMFRTPTYSKQEVSDSNGRVNGAYYYYDDIGERHDVTYEAGAKTGFNVNTPFPDSKVFNGLFYKGPSKGGGKPRGKSSIQQRLDGSYRFVSSGPDQRRTEVSDSSRNVRGSYTYVDDKGQQRTVEYIAGPNIGYRIVKKGVGPSFPTPPPFIPPPNFTDLPDVIRPSPSPSGSGAGSGRPSFGGSSGGGGFNPSRPPSGGSVSNFGGGIGKEDSSSPPDGSGEWTGNDSSSGSGESGPTDSGDDSGPPPYGGGSRPQGGGSRPQGGGSRPQGGIDYDSRPNGYGEGSRPNGYGEGSRPHGQVESGPHGIGGDDSDGNFSPGSGEGSGGDNWSTTSNPPSSKPPISFDGLFNPTISVGKKPGKGGSEYPLFPPARPTPPPTIITSSTTDIPVPGYPNGRPKPGSPSFPYPNNCCGGPTSSTPRPDIPGSAFPEDDPNAPHRPPRPGLDDFFQDFPPKEIGAHRPTSPPSGRPNYFYKPSGGDSTFLSSNKNYFSFPHGVAVRAHIQSLDILPFGSRIPPPGLALEEGISNSG